MKDRIQTMSKKWLTGLLTLTAALFIAFMLKPMQARAEFYNYPDELRMDGSCLSWNECMAFDNFGTPYDDIRYHVEIYQETGGNRTSLKKYSNLTVTYVDIAEVVGTHLNENIKADVTASVGAGLSYASQTGTLGPMVFHKVVFDTRGGSAVAQKYVSQGRAIPRPDNPTKSEESFAGWYKEETLQNLWKFGVDKMGTTDITLYAAWADNNAHKHEDGVPFYPWSNDNSMPTESGYYYLIQDVDLSAGWNVSGNVMLCLNGHSINGGNNPINVGSGATLMIYDCDKEGKGKITGFRQNAFRVDAGGLVRLYSGKITGNRYTGGYYGYGGAINVQGGTFEMFGGEISDNYSSRWGGGVLIKSGVFRMRDGIIKNNNAPEGGGGVYVYGGGFEISGGTITANTNGGVRYYSNLGQCVNMKIIPAVGKEETTDIKIIGNSGFNMMLSTGRTSNGSISQDFMPLRLEATMSHNSQIGISLDDGVRPTDGHPRTITENGAGSKTVEANFETDDSSYGMEYRDHEMVFLVKHKVTYDGNRAQGEMNPTIVWDGHNLELPENGFEVPAGHTFGGWYVDNDTWPAGQVLENITKNLTASAVWVPTQYALTYELNGGILPLGTSNPDSYTINDGNITLVNPLKTGYEFAGWDGTGISNPMTEVTIWRGSQGDRHYNACWDIMTYHITYNLNGGKMAAGDSNPEEYTVEDSFTLNNPVKDGHRFLGWYLKGTDEDETVEVTIPRGTTGDRTYIAMWEELCPDGHEEGPAKIQNNHPATCTEAGGRDLVYSCKTCGMELRRVHEDFPATGHQWNIETITQPSAHDDGEQRLTCQNCQATETRVLPAINHVHVYKHVGMQEPTCTADGVGEHFECELCFHLFVQGEGDTKTDLDPQEQTDDFGMSQLIEKAKGHFPADPEIQNETVASCTLPGGYDEVTKCFLCGTVLNSRHVTTEAALGHEWGDWKPLNTAYHVRSCARDEDHKETARHEWTTTTVKAKEGTDGSIHMVCGTCGAEENDVIFAPATFTLSASSFTYDGKAKTPAVEVKDSNDTEMDPSKYQVTYQSNVNAGTAKAVVTFADENYDCSKTLTFTINKAANPLAVKAKNVKVKASKVRRRAQKVAITKAVTFTNKGQGTLTYAKTGGNKKIVIDKKTGKITVKRRLKKGTYKVKIKIKAAGNANYNASADQIVTVPIKVK